jgi:hypothetical protein
MSTWNMPPGVSTQDIPGPGAVIVTSRRSPSAFGDVWCAYVGHMVAAVSHYGYGPTREAALEDLAANLAERLLEK